jgi:glycosyltransferase involved in cell wall biosynthesis
VKISFVIPAHNEAPLIGACLESILAEIAIFPCEHEIIVVDNASTDSTSEIAKKYAGVDYLKSLLLWVE